MLVHWIWLATRPGLHDRDRAALLEHFRDAEDIYSADEAHFSDLEELEKDTVDALLDKDLTQAQKILSQCEESDIHVLTLRDADYPARLRHIPDPPVVLYYKGILPDFEERPVIGVVGTRKASAYGLQIAKRMGYQIARCGGLVVSGMAFGVDGMSMEGALSADVPVVAVLGCGVDVVYPKSNRGLYEELLRRGCVLSEFVPGTPPYKWNFPKRNRIISGLSHGVLIVEAPERSGSLITARRAADQGRDVFVVPGNVDNPCCAGSNALLREGAIAAGSGWDVVGEYEAQFPGRVAKDKLQLLPKEAREPEKQTARVAQKPERPRNTQSSRGKQDKKDIDKSGTSLYSDVNNSRPKLNETEQAIVAQLESEDRLVDDVIAGVGSPAGAVLAALTMLQVKGVVKILPGRRVTLK